MSNPNPFASPHAAPGVGGVQGMDAGLSPNAATILAKTRGWVMLYAMLLYIGAAGLLLALAAAGNFLREIPQLSGLGSLMAVAIIIALGYVLAQAVMLTLFPSKIASYLRSRNPGEMATGLKNLRIFWILEGVRLLIMAVFGVIGLLTILVAL